jgi:hypothetical protein
MVKIVLPFMYAQAVEVNGFEDLILTEPNVGINSFVMGTSDTGALVINQDRVMSPAISIDYSGRSVSNNLDINSDGFNDLVVGYPSGDVVYVMFGPGYSSGFTVYTDVRGVLLGWSVSGAGDVNGDGFDDLIFGVPFADNGVLVHAGMSVVLFGRASQFTNIKVDVLTGSQGFKIFGAVTNDCSGLSVSSAGLCFVQ